MRVVRLAVLALILGAVALPACADWTLDYESGVARNTYNRFRVPGTTGTDIRLDRDFRVSPVTFQRWRLTYEKSPYKSWSLLYAPLTFHASGTAAQDISFAGSTIPSGSAVTGSYTFNSYRLTYRRTHHPEKDFSYSIGYTLKIRDAAIELSGGGVTGRDTNVGIVPLINFGAKWKLGNDLDFIIDGDALAATQGRAEDVLLGLNYHISDDAELRLGYRIVEGGVDNRQIYNFTTVQYLSAGVTGRF